jgi:predicted dehydrogenase
MEWSEGPDADRVVLHGEGRSVTLDPLDSGRLCLAGPDGRRQVVLEPAANPHVPLIADFVAAVADGRPPVCTVGEAILVDDLIVAAARSDALGGRPVRLPE